MEVVTMQRIICHDGRCWDPDRKKTLFENLFEGKSEVEQIEKELWFEHF